MGCFVMALVLFISSGSPAAAPASPQPLPVAEPELSPPLPTLQPAHREPIRRRADRVVEIDPGPIDGDEPATGEIELTEVDDLQAIDGAELEKDELDLTEADDSRAIDGEFQVTSDISLPVEIQDQLSLSDQLDRLKRLFDSGGLTEEEYHRAKSKLLA
jgi:hypothetical protein